MTVDSFDLILCDIHAPMIHAWRKAFVAHSEVEIVHGSIIDIAADAYVSPANGFGMMDGGIDIVLRDRFPLVESRVQDAIAARGEHLPVGHCVIVATGDFDVPYLLCAPTMLFPCQVAHTNHAFLAMQAILMEVTRFNSAGSKIAGVAVPGLCTGIGAMNPQDAAVQMAEAYRDWLALASD
ncbi:MAG: macro domain-containing protein [Fimbriimonadales bacterium]